MKNIQIRQFPNLLFAEDVLSAISDLRPSAKVKVLSLLNRLDTFGTNQDYLNGLEVRGEMGILKVYDASQSLQIIFENLEKQQFLVVELYSISANNVIGL